MLLGGKWQINGGLASEPDTDDTSFHLNSLVGMVSLYAPVLSEESDLPQPRYVALWPVTQLRVQTALEATIPLEHSSHYIFLLHSLCVHKRETCWLAQTQKQLMEVTVRLTVSDEAAGCWAEEQLPLYPTKLSQKDWQIRLLLICWSFSAYVQNQSACLMENVVPFQS